MIHPETALEEIKDISKKLSLDLSRSLSPPHNVCRSVTERHAAERLTVPRRSATKQEGGQNAKPLTLRSRDLGFQLPSLSAHLTAATQNAEIGGQTQSCVATTEIVLCTTLIKLGRF